MKDLGELGVFTALVPGAQDVPLREFLRLAKDAEVESPTLHVAHATLWEEGDVAVCGLGGELSEDQDRADGQLCHSSGVGGVFPPHAVACRTAAQGAASIAARR